MSSGSTEPTPIERLSTAQGGGQALSLVGLKHRYPTTDGPVEALGPINLEISAGSFVTLVGPSGCGKTTLLQVIGGFLTPSGGRAELAGRTIVAPGRERGVVFQQPTSLLPWLDVRRNVELGPRLRGVGKAERRRRALLEIERVGLTEFADRRIDELSGGMQQRCQIARVLANDPEVMLMDEPFGALDALTRERLQGELRTIWRQTGRTIVLITHSVEEAVALGSRVIVMSPRPGTVILDEAMPFAGSDTSLDEVRSTDEFVAACSRVRAAIR